MIITIYYAVIIVLYNNCICFDAFDENFSITSFQMFFSRIIFRSFFIEFPSIIILIFIGSNWALDNNYVGSVSTQLRSISMYSEEIGVVGAVRGGNVYVRYPGTYVSPFDFGGTDSCLSTYSLYFVTADTISNINTS